jgi:hypothetical protein
VVLAAVLALWVTGGSDAPTFGQPSGVPQSVLRSFPTFAVYGAGPRVGGLALTGNDLTSATARPDSVSLFYGRCPLSGGDESGCAFPLEIQTWRACDRSPGLGAVDRVSFASFRGARLATFPDGRDEIYTGSATVVIFADPALARAAEAKLAPVNALARAESPAHGLAAPARLSYKDLVACP